MKHVMHRIVGLSLLAACCLGDAPVQAQPANQTGFWQTPLFSRMVAVNQGLRSYRARVHLDAAMSSFPFLHPTLDGTAYFKRPDRTAIVFDDAPAMGGIFKTVFPRLPTPQQWPAQYRVQQISAAPNQVELRLTPRKEGRVSALDVTVDPASAVPTGYTFRYRDGGTITFSQQVVSEHGYVLVSGLDGVIDLPAVKASAKASFVGYQINVPVTDAQVDGSTK